MIDIADLSGLSYPVEKKDSYIVLFKRYLEKS